MKKQDKLFENVFYTDCRKIKLAVRNFINSINQSPQRIIDRLCVKI